MRRLAFIMIALLPSLALADDCDEIYKTYGHSQPPAEWYNCQEDSDCALARGVCNTEAVSKAHKSEHDEWAACVGATVNCAMPEIHAHQAICNAGHCAMQEKK